MLFLAQHLPAEDFKRCIDFVLNDNIWLEDAELTKDQKTARNTFKEELQSFKDEAFIDELKEVDINKDDPYRHHAAKKLFYHFIQYEGVGPGLCYLRANDLVSELKDFIKKINIS